MAILIVFSGFMAIIVLGSILVALNDALEAMTGRGQAASGSPALSWQRRAGGRRGARRSVGSRSAPYAPLATPRPRVTPLREARPRRVPGDAGISRHASAASGSTWRPR